MNILYIDDVTHGHHAKYISALANSGNFDSEAILPNKIEHLNSRQFVYHGLQSERRSFLEYMRWIREIDAIVRKVKPDVVHFLDGDFFYRYFGFGLGHFRRYHPVMTFHWLRSGRLQQLSLKRICRRMSRVVVHSEYLKEQLCAQGSKNIEHVEYPQFEKIVRNTAESRRFWKLDEHLPTIVCIGNTRRDKGLDILLEALKSVNQPFQLLIAGKEEAFGEAFILEQARNYRKNVRLCLRYLTDEELSDAVGAADIIALPYRRCFNGASGPLTEGVYMNKCIVGSDHGNLGDTIRKNHLGYTFETENAAALAAALNRALGEKFAPDAQYAAYRGQLDPACFVSAYEKIYRLLSGKNENED